VIANDRVTYTRSVEREHTPKSERVTLWPPLLLHAVDDAQESEGCGALLASHWRASSSLLNTLVS
jgi:hypothetical protein